MIRQRLSVCGTLFAAYPRGVPLAAAAVAASAVATALEGFGIVMVLPFLQRLIQGRAEALVVPIAQARALQDWINGLSDSSQLVALGTLVVGSVAGREALLYLAGYLKLLVSMRVADVHRARLHEAFVRAPFAFTSRYPHGHFLNSLYTEANRVRQLVTQVITVSQTAVVGGTVIVVMALISVRLMVAVLALQVVLGIPLMRLFRWVHTSGAGRVQTRIDIMNYLAELMPFLRAVHVFQSQAHEVSRFRARYREVTQRDLRLHVVNSAVGPVYHVAGALTVLGIIVVGLWLGPGGGTAWLIPFVLLFVRFLPILNEVNHALAFLADGFAAYERLQADLGVLEARPMAEGRRAFPETFGAIELRDVGFAYEADAPVLQGVSLRIERGRHVALVGPSGCGKSTVCLLLCRLYDPDGGAVTVDGLPLGEFTLASLRQAITLVEQTPILLNDSIRANIAYGTPEASDDDIRRAAKRAHADEFIHEFPQGYDTGVGNLGTAISGGQRQRIALARALVREPQILILDEATSAVDSRSEALIKAAIDDLKSGMTIVSVAHRLATIKDADEIHFLSGGRIVCSGTFAELVARDPEFREYVKAQDLSEPPP